MPIDGHYPFWADTFRTAIEDAPSLTSLRNNWAVVETSYQEKQLSYADYQTVYQWYLTRYAALTGGTGAGAGVGAGAGAGVGAGAGAGTDVQNLLGDPIFWEGIFEQAMGIPVAGRGFFAKWLASQWQTPATEYALQQAGGAVPQQTFAEYMQGRRTQPVSQFVGLGGQNLRGLTGLSPTEQATRLENLPGYVPQEAFYGGLRERYPAWLAQGLLKQAFAPEAQRAFALQPSQLQAIPTDTFLNYLQRSYGL